MSPVISRPFLAAARATFARVFGSVGNLAGQNSLRNPRRTAATASALMIGLALACTMAIVGDSAKASVDKSVAENFVGDFVVSNVIGQGFSPTIGDQMAAGRRRRPRGARALQPRPSATATTSSSAAVDPADVDSLELDVTRRRRADRRLGAAAAVLGRRRGPRGRRRPRPRPAGGRAHLLGRRDLRGQPGRGLRRC